MSDQKSARKYRFLDVHEIIENLVAEGAQLIYCREALFPVVEAQVRIREKSRERMGDMEKTILSILQTCPVAPESLGRLMGIAGGKLYPTLVELEGRGLMEQDGAGAFRLSELGRLSCRHGVEVVEVDRALLLCGVTGRLLPRSLYSLERVLPDAFKKLARNVDIIPEEQHIRLTALDLSRIPDRRAVNLADETMEIQGILEHKPIFLRGILAFYRTAGGTETVEMVFPDTVVDWLPAERLRDFVAEPLGFSARKKPEQVVSAIGDILREAGVETNGPVALDAYQNPVVGIESMAPSLLPLDYRNARFLEYIGTDLYPPVPIGQFPFGGNKGFQRKINDKMGEDLLYGHVIRFRATGTELQTLINALRCMKNALTAYYRLSRSQRTCPLLDHIRADLAAKGLDPDAAIDLGQRHGSKNLRNKLTVADD